MVEELEKLAVEMEKLEDVKLRRQFKCFVKALRIYMAELDSFLKVMVRIYRKEERVKRNDAFKLL